MTENSPVDWSHLRERMVKDQIEFRGVSDLRVLDAMRTIPRELFVPFQARVHAYDDRALPITAGQTISQPFIVAYMTERLALQPHHRVLEIGTGSGYQCAVLATLAARVYSVERIDQLREDAERTLSGLGFTNVSLFAGDGSVGLPEFAPYDRIIVTAAAPSVPASLVDQLADQGRLVVPVGEATEQTIMIITRDGPHTRETATIGCRFVKLIGQQAWNDPSIEKS